MGTNLNMAGPRPLPHTGLEPAPHVSPGAQTLLLKTNCYLYFFLTQRQEHLEMLFHKSKTQHFFF